MRAVSTTVSALVLAVAATAGAQPYLPPGPDPGQIMTPNPEQYQPPGPGGVPEAAPPPAPPGQYRAPAPAELPAPAPAALPAPGPGLGPRFDPRAVTPLSGVVVSVGTTNPTPGGRQAIYLVVRSGTSTVVVDVAPGWYLHEQNLLILPGDAIRITGARVRTGTGQPAFIATQLSRGGQVIQLRDPYGRPLWRGQP
ncbi:MAG TPA: hypothetical protein VGQ83_07640 [Polyangia bacterium]|jgi:hypothetical protein